VIEIESSERVSGNEGGEREREEREREKRER
jgi:hypothetical protein